MTMKLWKFSSHMSDTDLLGGDHNSPECVYIVWEKGGTDLELVKYMTWHGLVGYKVVKHFEYVKGPRSWEHTSYIKWMVAQSL